MWPPRDCRECRADARRQFCQDCEHRRELHPSDPSCTRPDCTCERARGAPVTVGTGSHTIIPINVMHVDGPWALPLDFSVYFSQENLWTGILDETTNPQVPDGNFLGPGWSHTLSESVVVTEIVTTGGATVEKRVPPNRQDWSQVAPTGGYPGNLSMNPNFPTLPFRRLYYRLPNGEFYEFYTVNANSKGTDFFQLLPDGWYRMANHRSSPYRLEFQRAGTTVTGFRVFDLATGVRSEFDANGRLISKRAPTAGGGWFGWSVNYAAAPNGMFTSIVHDSGARIVHQPVGGWFGTFHLLGVSDPPGTAATLANQWARINDPSGQVGIANSLFTKVLLTRTGKHWLIQYRQVNSTPPIRTDQAAIVSITDPSGVVSEIAQPQPTDTCAAVGATMFRRARAAEDPNGRFEFRRAGTLWADNGLCSNRQPHPLAGFNPCASQPTAKFAVLDMRQLQRNPATNALISCTYAPNAVNNGGCAAGFSCTERAITVGDQVGIHVCARYTCQAGGYDEDANYNPDEVTEQLTTDGCGNSTNFWRTYPLDAAGEPQRVRRLESHVDAQGIRTSYVYDIHGRMIARCIGDDAATEGGVPGAPHLWSTGSIAPQCPGTAVYEEWTYGDSESVNNTWAIARHKRRNAVLTDNQLAVEEFNYSPGVGGSNPWLLESIVQNGRTNSTVVGPSLNYQPQQRVLNLTYHPTTGAITKIDTGAGGFETTFTYYTATDGTENRLRLKNTSVRSELAGNAASNLTTTLENYTVEGVPLKETSPTGVLSTMTIDAQTRLPTSVTVAGRTSFYGYGADYRLLSVKLPTGQGIFFEYTSTHPEPSAVHITDTPLNVNMAGLPNASMMLQRTLNPFAIQRETAIVMHQVPAADATIRSSLGIRDDHDRLGQVANTDIASPNEKTNITYDLQNRVWKVRDGQLNETQYTYDSESRVYEVARGHIDGGGAFVETQRIRIRYLNQSNLPNQVEYITPGGGVPYQGLDYRYNEFGEMVESYSADLGLRRFRYDQHGRLSEQLESDNSRTAFTYDRAGRTRTIDRDADNTGIGNYVDDQQFYWDSLPAGTACPPGSTCANLNGRLALVQSKWMLGELKTFYGYTSQGQLAEETLQTTSSSYFRTAYGYDSAGRLTDIIYPLLTGDGAHYSYAGTGIADDHQVSRLDNSYYGTNYPLVDRIEREAGAISKMWFHQHGNGALPANPSVERNYRLDGRLSRVQWRMGANSSATLGDYTYSYHNSGQIAGIVNAPVGAQGMPSAAFQYDDEGRITCAANTSANCAAPNANRYGSYTYDVRGNRTSAQTAAEGVGVQRTFDYSAASNAGRLNYWTQTGWGVGLGMNIAWGSGTSAYGGPGQRWAEWRNANGGAEPGVARYDYYYSSGRPAQVSTYDVRGWTTSVFAYDHTGRRRARTQTLANGDTISELFFYDLYGRNLGVYTSKKIAGVSSTRQEPIFWVDNEPVARYVFDSGAWSDVSYFYNDQTGTPRLAVKVTSSYANPEVKYRSSMEPFLAGPPTTDPAMNGGQPVRLRFPGQWEDNGTDMQWAGGSVNPAMGSLVANHARNYEPGYGGYLQGEPLLGYGHIAGVEGITPWFGYAGYRPNELVDPDGELVAAVVGALIAIGVVGYAAYWNHNEVVPSHYRGDPNLGRALQIYSEELNRVQQRFPRSQPTDNEAILYQTGLSLQSRRNDIIRSGHGNAQDLVLADHCAEIDYQRFGNRTTGASSLIPWTSLLYDPLKWLVRPFQQNAFDSSRDFTASPPNFQVWRESNEYLWSSGPGVFTVTQPEIDPMITFAL